MLSTAARAKATVNVVCVCFPFHGRGMGTTCGLSTHGSAVWPQKVDSGSEDGAANFLKRSCLKKHGRGGGVLRVCIYVYLCVIYMCVYTHTHTHTHTHTQSPPSISMGSASADSTNHGLKIYEGKKQSQKAKL